MQSTSRREVDRRRREGTIEESKGDLGLFADLPSVEVTKWRCAASPSLAVVTGTFHGVQVSGLTYLSRDRQGRLLVARRCM